MATELGQAYIQIMPSAKGISGNIEKELNGGQSGASKAGGKMGGALKLGLTAAVAGVGAIVGKAILSGGELQQNLGGTEAVFGNFSKKIQSSAAKPTRIWACQHPIIWPRPIRWVRYSWIRTKPTKSARHNQYCHATSGRRGIRYGRRHISSNGIYCWSC